MLPSIVLLRLADPFSGAEPGRVKGRSSAANEKDRREAGPSIA